MNESRRWTASRYATLTVVLLLHAALLAALLIKSQFRGLPASQTSAVELMFVAPLNPPKNAALRRIGAATTITIGPPQPESPSLPSSSGASPATGDGSQVDWTAEARRALQAFEIRSHQLSSNKSVAGRPEEDNWLPNTPHRAGEQLKTANGDWIVWINANCYEIASSGPQTAGAAQPETICRRHSNGAAQ